MILVDTSVWVDYFNGHPSDEAAYLTICIAEARGLAIPGLVLTEILLGARNGAEAARISGVMSAFDLAPELERADYERAAGLYRDCRARGVTPRSTVDCLIAQVCLKQGYELLARDRDFAAIAQVAPLRLTIPSLGVQERAAQYALHAPARRRPVTPPRSSRSRRSSRASAPRSRASRH